LSFDTTVSRGLSGGHGETHGLTSDRQVIEIAEHRHEVELNLARYELALSRTLSDAWDIGLRIPYMVREQTADVRFSGGASDADHEAAVNNGRIHHRTETYEGFADLELIAGWRTRDVPWLGDDSVMRISFGSTIPIGATEEDPWLLGDAGHEHLHIQFGNGTFDPLLDLYVGAPISKKLAWGLYSKARLPIYRNSHGYRGAPEVTLSPRLTWLPVSKVSLSAGVVGLYYGYSSWEETGRDRNSGQVSVLGSLSVGYKVNDSVTASFSALLPFYTESFSSEDSLDPAPTFSFSLGYTF
jgi:hypothetical protein